MEKEATTPDIYPLSLNALVNACNQKSNRSPVIAVGEEEVEAALALLREKHLVTLFSGAGARAVKYRHKFSEAWPVEPTACALMCELLLRGPQTAAGLRSNCERLAAIPPLNEVEAVLSDLAVRGMVGRQERRAGQKEARWTALIVEGAEVTTAGDESGDAGADVGGRPTMAVAMTMKLPAEAEARIAALEEQVSALRAELAELKAQLGE